MKMKHRIDVFTIKLSFRILSFLIFDQFLLSCALATIILISLFRGQFCLKTIHRAGVIVCGSVSLLGERAQQNNRIIFFLTVRLSLETSDSFLNRVGGIMRQKNLGCLNVVLWLILIFCG